MLTMRESDTDELFNKEKETHNAISRNYQEKGAIWKKLHMLIQILYSSFLFPLLKFRQACSWLWK